MFGRKKAETQSLEWDGETTQYLAKLDSFEVTITSVTKRFGFGGTGHGTIGDRLGFDVAGILSFPRYIPVNFTFESSGNEARFGGWSYNVWDRLPRNQRLPFIEVWLHDPDCQIGEALYEAHQAALKGGRRTSNARLWKRAGQGLMTPTDKEHGYSYQSRYELLGMYTWATSQASQLPSWALPYASEGFSAAHIPSGMEVRAL